VRVAAVSWLLPTAVTAALLAAGCASQQPTADTAVYCQILQRAEPDLLAVMTGDVTGDLNPPIQALAALTPVASTDLVPYLQRLIDDLHAVQQANSTGNGASGATASAAATRDVQPIDDANRSQCGVTLAPEPPPTT
jgi:hypothetical protein